MPLRRKGLSRDEVVAQAVQIARDPRLMGELSPRDHKQVEPVLKAIQAGATGSTSVRGMHRAKAITAQALAQRAVQSLDPSSNVTPASIQLALQEQGMDWVQPFAPGAPLQPFYGYDRRPRNYDYNIGRNVTTDTRPDRIPYATLLQLFKSYDICQICTRHAINDLRSMRIRFEPMDGYEGKNPSADLARAKEFWRRPDGVRSFRNFLAQHAMDVWRYDAGTMFKQRDKAGNLKSLKVVDGTTIAPMLDYFGDRPQEGAPAYQQFIQGIPWDWLNADDLIYEPMWPEPESPYGTPPLETVLVNANTDIRLQMYFLQFFTAGNVPEAFAIAPEDQSDPDSLAELQETWQDWTYGDQSERWGLRWLPNGTEIEPYKPQEFDPDIAEYVMRRTVSAFMMVPNDMGFTADVNKASSETQVDVQFRIGTSPNSGYYEDIFDSITQQDLGLQVQMRFDTGREKEDRLMEAKAHQIYVSMGAESPSEVREKILGHPINPEEKVPLFFDSLRLGPVPMAYLLSIAGDVDPLTGMPKPGSVEPREFVVPGMMAPDPLVDGPQPAGTPNARPDPDEPDPPKAPARKGDDDLRKWKSNARKAVARGKSPREFADSTIDPDTYARVWAKLEKATTRDEVDAAFKVQWSDFHHHTDLIIDHYTPMVQRAMREVLAPELPRILAAVGQVRKAPGNVPPATPPSANVPGAPTPVVAGALYPGVALTGAGAAVGAGAAGAGVVGAAGVAAALLAIAHAPRFLEGLKRLLGRLYGDAYMQGAHEAAGASGGEMPPWTEPVPVPDGYWDHWTPGVGEEAEQSASGGLADLLAERDIWIKEMTDTQVNRIGQAIEDAIDASPVDMAELTRAVDEIVNDEKRARLIAETEYARALVQGSMDTYRLNNVPEVAWLEQPGACALCQENHAVSPLPIDRAWPNGAPPVHPNCRCALAPAFR